VRPRFETLHIIKLRASQITAARTASICTGKTRAPQAKPSSGSMDSMHWRESPYYTIGRRAALEWTESLTLIRVRTRRTRRSPHESAILGKRDRRPYLCHCRPLIPGTGLRFRFERLPGHYQPPAEIFSSQLKMRKFLFVMRGFLRAGQLRTETGGGQGEVAECLNKKPSSKQFVRRS